MGARAAQNLRRDTCAHVDREQNTLCQQQTKMADDELWGVRNAFHLGCFQQAIAEAMNVSEDSRVLANFTSPSVRRDGAV